ncbi:MAG: hypothetical protein A2312_04400 [Candidatus Staskawiczbacteria bacterium RIFOXYB2_FULL_32_9]|uniref:Conjugal transfer protein TrbC n=1 Tax=Candidatus Staskawiczbacteria bacterium RIFOXYD1_FULL_32_13 TaxID=1802234 RepID=A0A1G2JK86_9BACT|nr:MAG: hypothetical protein UR22_C0009G0008 [Parcubacteria group bacterium GW2011_GWC2_32_10]OGZ78755.1 MAG: hypothetical protein A2360_01045 [Candidatus Staskawiczbacteria bacterium RIFOXYB1_FULL_32_11]OGZ81863.1 MAG: hypothetical protein A2312_04400 [Candidatus Staskawiczbacteria bacterium RIFOXYB2_FULL_32_9]OGZ85316.1 MAG: hypothetical protein A2463_00830 [Candidatus Staskawiczbacteria bacterium RIFOXYC2_FULL_32_10]OGZ87524.1 MAG: hypothetical protein A2561_00855 [Candidatus Staskawiczbacte
MKTLKIIVSLLLLSVLLTPVLASAVIPAPPTTSVTDLSTLYDKIATLMWQIFAIVALVLFVIAGIMFLTAQGDPAKVATARLFVLWGIVGIVVAAFAFSIVEIVGTFIT